MSPRPKNYSRREKLAIYMLFLKRVCLNNDFVLVTDKLGHIPAVYCGDVTKRLEQETFMSERVLKLSVFLTSSGRSAARLTSSNFEQSHISIRGAHISAILIYANSAHVPVVFTYQ